MKKIRKEEIRGYIDPRLELDASRFASSYVREAYGGSDDYLYDIFYDWFVYYNQNYNENTTLSAVISDWYDSDEETRCFGVEEESPESYDMHIKVYYDDDELINFLLYCEERSDNDKPYETGPKQKRKVVEENREEEIIL